jgi:hypothetical protein
MTSTSFSKLCLFAFGSLCWSKWTQTWKELKRCRGLIKKYSLERILTTGKKLGFLLEEWEEKRDGDHHNDERIDYIDWSNIYKIEEKRDKIHDLNEGSLCVDNKHPILESSDSDTKVSPSLFRFSGVIKHLHFVTSFPSLYFHRDHWELDWKSRKERVY